MYAFSVLQPYSEKFCSNIQKYHFKLKFSAKTNFNIQISTAMLNPICWSSFVFYIKNTPFGNI